MPYSRIDSLEKVRIHQSFGATMDILKIDSGSEFMNERVHSFLDLKERAISSIN